MTEQDKFRSLLQNLIRETENDNITSTDELINLIVDEFQKKLIVASNG